MKFLAALFVLSVALIVYVRLSPNSAEKWHVAPEVDRDKSYSNGVLRRVENAPDGLGKLHEVIGKDASTQVLAGDVASGMVTYLSRTKLMGYPDFTTIKQDGDTLLIHGRSRFGKRDFGVNAKRVDGWIAALTAQ
jgi:uncharacterized protein (DUF1499 family)